MNLQVKDPRCKFWSLLPSLKHGALSWQKRRTHVTPRHSIHNCVLWILPPESLQFFSSVHFYGHCPANTLSPSSAIAWLDFLLLLFSSPHGRYVEQIEIRWHNFTLERPSKTSQQTQSKTPSPAQGWESYAWQARGFLWGCCTCLGMLSPHWPPLGFQTCSALSYLRTQLGQFLCCGVPLPCTLPTRITLHTLNSLLRSHLHRRAFPDNSLAPFCSPSTFKFSSSHHLFL